MEKIMDIVGMIATDNGVSEEQVIEAIKESMVKMAKKQINEDANFSAMVDTDSKDLRLVQKMLVCDDSEYCGARSVFFGIRFLNSSLFLISRILSSKISRCIAFPLIAAVRINFLESKKRF